MKEDFVTQTNNENFDLSPWADQEEASKIYNFMLTNHNI